MSDESDSQIAFVRSAERALRLLKEAVSEVNIPDASEYVGSRAYYLRSWAIREEDWGKKTGEWPEKRWEIFKFELARDVILCIQINNTLLGVSWMEISLLLVAADLVRGAEKILNGPDANSVFDISTQEERDGALDDNVRQTLVSYIKLLPLMLAQAIDQTYQDSIQRQIKMYIQPLLREHWRSIGLPENFDFLEGWNHQSYATGLDQNRQVFLGLKRPALPKELPQYYKDLRIAYKTAKKYHDEKKSLFLSSGNRRNNTSWREYWEKDSLEIFPNLAPSCLMMLCEGSYEPRELAYQDLAYQYGRSPEYLRKRISALTPRKNQIQPERHS